MGIAHLAFEAGASPAWFTCDKAGSATASLDDSRCNRVSAERRWQHGCDLDHAKLELVGERGDPAPLVYARLFAAYPDMERLFVRDANGLVRGNMLAEAISAILDFIGRDTYGGNLMRVEIVNHENLGVPREVFPAFFATMRDAFAVMLEDSWSAEIDLAWRELLARIDAILVPQNA